MTLKSMISSFPLSMCTLWLCRNDKRERRFLATVGGGRWTSRAVKCKMSRRVKSGKQDDVISLPEWKHVTFDPQLCRERLIYSKLKPYFLSKSNSSILTHLHPWHVCYHCCLKLWQHSRFVVLFSLEVTKVNSTVSSHVGPDSSVSESRPLSRLFQPASPTHKTRHKLRCFWETQTQSRPPQAVNWDQGQIPVSH